MSSFVGGYCDHHDQSADACRKAALLNTCSDPTCTFCKTEGCEYWGKDDWKGEACRILTEDMERWKREHPDDAVGT